MIPVVIVIPVFVAIFAYIVPVLVSAVAIIVSVPRSGVSPAAVVSVMIIPSGVNPAAIVGIMIITLVPHDTIIPEARIVIIAEPGIISEACFIGASPLPIFLLALTVEPVVLDIVVLALGKPFPIIRIVVSVVAAGTAVCVWIVLITVLRASRRQNCSRSQSGN
jgi:hypothetical protein